MENGEKKGLHILFTGDSLTDGNRYKKKEQAWDLNHQIGHTYVYIINGILGSMFPEKHFCFTSRGVSGNRVLDVYARSEVDLYPLKPDILSVLVGVNDGPGDRNYFEPTPREKYGRIYRQLLGDARERLPECRMILLEPFVCNAGKMKKDGSYPVWREAISGYAEEARAVAEEFGCKFLPLQKLFDEKCAEFEPEYWCWDGVHPTENGHGLIAREWIKAMAGELGIEGKIGSGGV